MCWKCVCVISNSYNKGSLTVPAPLPTEVTVRRIFPASFSALSPLDFWWDFVLLVFTARIKCFGLVLWVCAHVCTHGVRVSALDAFLSWSLTVSMWMLEMALRPLCCVSETHSGPAGLEPAVWWGMTLNFCFSCFSLPKCGDYRCATYWLYT